MKQINYEKIKETLYTHVLDNGLEVYIIPKKGYSEYYASLTTNYGSIHNNAKIDGRVISNEAGIAHFLEHKMFEKETGDVFEVFGKRGANANAFTSFNMTSYLFSCTSLFEDNLKTLIDFVNTPYFTAATVEKEQGIIGQEIKMYQDEPGWRLYFELLRCLYIDHPATIDIAGTIESISKITDQTLYDCHQAFYNPKNMKLVVVGDVNPKEIVELVTKQYQNYSFDEFNTEFILKIDDEGVSSKSGSLSMDVSRPKLLVGIKDKDPNYKGIELLKKKYCINLLLSIIFGKSSDFKEKLFESGLIDDSFATEPIIDYSYGHVLIGGDSDEPSLLAKEIIDVVKNVKKINITKEQFERVKNNFIGINIAGFNYVEGIGRYFTNYIFNDINYFDSIDVLKSITLDDLKHQLDFFDENQLAYFIINPHNKK